MKIGDVAFLCISVAVLGLSAANAFGANRENVLWMNPAIAFSIGVLGVSGAIAWLLMQWKRTRPLRPGWRPVLQALVLTIFLAWMSWQCCELMVDRFSTLPWSHRATIERIETPPRSTTGCRQYVVLSYDGGESKDLCVHRDPKDSAYFDFDPRDWQKLPVVVTGRRSALGIAVDRVTVDGRSGG